MSSNAVSFMKGKLSKSTSFFGVPLWVLFVASTAAFIIMTFIILCTIFFICYRHRKSYKSCFPLPIPIASKHFHRAYSSSSLNKRLLSGNVPEIQMNFEKFSGYQVNNDIMEDGYFTDLESRSIFKRVRRKNSFSMKEIEKATNGLAKENVIGRGDHGIVYLGLLQDSTRVAVKALESDSCQTEDFVLQMEAIGHVKHKKLVKLLGYCTKGAYRISVSEYVDNGNLHQWLHEYPEQVSPLTWDIRLKIIQGVAKGLAYLHEDVEPKVLHGSLKSSNILLDRQWNSKVSDFGLAKLCSAERSHNIMETLGYIFPDCSTSTFTESNDIYSFGILIMEIVSGKILLDHRQPQPYLVDWFKSMIANEKIDYVVDSKLPEMPPSKELKQMILISLRCVDPDVNPKLKMGDVIRMLEPHDFLLSNELQVAREAYEHNHSPQSHTAT